MRCPACFRNVSLSMLELLAPSGPHLDLVPQDARDHHHHKYVILNVITTKHADKWTFLSPDCFFRDVEEHFYNVLFIAYNDMY